MTPGSTQPSTRFREEFADFRRFVRRPRLARAPHRAVGPLWKTDWRLGMRPGRLLAWAACLWAINVFALGPLALMAAGAGGASHRIDIDALPWLQAILWAPLVEELLFRYGLRRPLQALWLVPVMAAVVLNGPQVWTGALAAAAVGTAWLQTHASRRLGGWRWRRRYVRNFGWFFHAATLAFAVVHLANYRLNDMPYWLMPLLVLPQWVTGLVLGWLRVRRGIGAAVVLHAVFNGGPVLLVLLVMHTAPDLAT